jgi:hypothetical protein
LAFPESRALFNFLPHDEKVEDSTPPAGAASSARWDEGPLPLGRDFSSQICSRQCFFSV